MSSTMLTTIVSTKVKKPRRKKPFDQHAKEQLRGLLDALRDIGDRPDLNGILQRYDVSEAGLKAFVKSVEFDAFAS